MHHASNRVAGSFWDCVLIILMLCVPSAPIYFQRHAMCVTGVCWAQRLPVNHTDILSVLLSVLVNTFRLFQMFFCCLKRSFYSRQKNTYSYEGISLSRCYFTIQIKTIKQRTRSKRKCRKSQKAPQATYSLHRLQNSQPCGRRVATAERFWHPIPTMILFVPLT